MSEQSYTVNTLDRPEYVTPYADYAQRVAEQGADRTGCATTLVMPDGARWECYPGANWGPAI